MLRGDVKIVLRWFYSGSTVVHYWVLQWLYGGSTVVQYSGSTVVLQWFYQISIYGCRLKSFSVITHRRFACYHILDSLLCWYEVLSQSEQKPCKFFAYFHHLKNYLFWTWFSAWVLRWFYNGSTVVLQWSILWFYGGSTVVLQWSNSVVLRWFYDGST